MYKLIVLLMIANGPNHATVMMPKNYADRLSCENAVKDMSVIDGPGKSDAEPRNVVVKGICVKS